MKETRTINVNGLVFNIDNDAFQALNNYLQDIELRLPADEREDVMTDIEARVSELLQAALFAKNVQVVDIKMVTDIQTRIGAPSEFGGSKRPKIKVRSSENSGCGRVLKITLIVIAALIAAQVLVPILAVLFGLCMAALGIGVGAISFLPTLSIPFFGGHWGLAFLAIIAGVFAVCLPIYAVIKTIVSFIRNHKAPEGRFWLIAILLWLLSIGCFSFAVYKQATRLPEIKALPQPPQVNCNDNDSTTFEESMENWAEEMEDWAEGIE